jgi:RHS repeat-associated protein
MASSPTSRFGAEGRSGRAARRQRRAVPERAARAIAAAEALEARRLLTAITFTGGSGNWNVAGNWSPAEVPGGGDAVTIPAGATVDVTDGDSAMSTEAAAGSTIDITATGVLSAGTGTIAGTLNDAGLFYGSGSASAPLVLAGTTNVTLQLNDSYFQNTGQLNLTGAGAIVLRAHVTNDGTVTVTGGANLQSGTFTNDAGHTIALGDDTTTSGGTILNSGVIAKTAGTGASILSGGGVIEDYGGTVSADSGTLTIGDQSFFQNTSFTAAAGAAVSLDQSQGTSTGNAYFSGTVTGSGAGHLDFTSGTVNPGNPSTGGSTLTTFALDFPQGFAQVTGMTFRGNTPQLTNAGYLQFVGDAQHPAIDLDNTGTIVVSGAGDLGFGNQTAFVNGTTGVIDLTTDAGLANVNDGNGGSFYLTNKGLIEKTGGTGTSSIGTAGVDGGGSVGVGFEDEGGTISAQTGTIDFPAGGTFENTTFTAAAGATVSLDDADGTGDGVAYYLSGTLTGSGAGNLVFAGNGVATGGPYDGSFTPTTGAILNFPAGFAQVTGTIFQSGGATQIVNQAFLDYTGAAQHAGMGIDNKGTIDVTGAGNLGASRDGGFINDTTGVLDFQTDAGVTNVNGGTSFTNMGLIEKTGGTGDSIIGTGTGSIGFANDGGTFDVESGTLSIANGGGSFAFTIPAGGVTAATGADFDLGGAGNTDGISVQGSLTVSGGGTFSLSGDYLDGPSSGAGQSTASPATLNFDTDQFTVDGGGFGDNVDLINEGEIDFSSGDMGNLLNQGTVTLGSGVIVDSGAVINAAGGVILSGTSDGIFRQGNNGNVQNAGVFVMSPGAGNTFDMTGTEIYNTGTLIFGPGTTDLPWLSNSYDIAPGLFPTGSNIPAGSTFQLDAGATVDVDTSPSLSEIDGTVIMNAGSSFPALDGVNTITGSWSVLSGDSVSLTGGLTNNGTLSVGGSVAVNGTFTQAVEQNVSSPPTPALDFEVAAAAGSAGAPLLSVTGAATLAGNLTADYVDGYTGSAGAYTVATFAGGATGSFASTAGTAPFFMPSISASRIVLNGTAFSGTGGSNPGGITIPVGGTGGGGGGTTTPTPTPTGTDDLAISSVTAPASFTPGSPQTITWAVTNSGTGATSGSWEDSVYLSTGTALSDSDVLVGRVTQSNPVAPAGSYTGTLTVNMPAVAPGPYYVIVVVDSRQTLGETSYANNAAVSAVTTETVPALTLGQTTSGTLVASQQQLYALSVTAGESVQLGATFAAALEADLYVSFDALPTPQSYDQAATNPAQTSAALNLKSGQSGTFYVLVDGRPDIASAESFTLTPAAPVYGPDAVSPTACANSGEVTLDVQGQGFTPSTTVSLVSPNSGAADTPATSVLYVSGNELYAIFRFNDAVPGTFSVRTSEGTAGPSGTLAGAITIKNTLVDGTAAASPGELEYQLSAPSYFRVNSTGMVTLSYENIGGSDVAAPLFDITSDNASFALADDPTNYVEGSIEVLGDNPTGPAGLLTPGASGSVTIYFQQDASAAHVVSTFDAYLFDGSTKTDWSSLSSGLQPVGEQDDAWAQTFSNFEAIVGTTEGSYASVLDNLDDYLSSHGERTSDASMLLHYELQVAGDFGQIEQRYAASDFGRGIPDPYNIGLTFDKAGNVAVGDDEQYTYFALSSGTFTPVAPDTGTFVLNSDGTYTWTQADGSEDVFNANGALDYEQDSNGFPETATIANGLVTAMTSTNGVASFVYNSASEVVSATDPSGSTTTYTYDSNGNLLTATNLQGTTTYVYATPADHAATQVTYPDGTEADYQYDAFGRVTQQSAAGGAEAVTFTYDPFGNATQTDALGHTSTAFHGLGGQVVASEDGLGNITTAGTTTGQTGVTSVTGPDGVQTTVNQDSSGDVTSATTPNGATASVSYNAQGLPSSVTDPKGNTTTLDYDAAGNPTSITDAAGNSDTYTYNGEGEPASTTTAAGRVINGVYNSIGQLVSQAFSDGTTATYTYDSFGNVASATNSIGTVSFVYNAQDLLTKVSYSDGLSLTYTYNAQEQLAQEIDQNGFASNYAYNSLGQLVSVTDAAGNVVARYTYDAAGNVTRVDDGNGTYTTYTFDADNRETGIVSYAAGGTIVSSFAYTYNAAGEITSMTTLAGTTSYAYDANGQLTTVNLPTGQNVSYVYDAAGNRVSSTESGVATSYATNDLNQYTTVGSTSYVYDADGNLVSSTTAGVTTTYTYNVENELTSMSSPSSTSTYQYDALGDRIATTTNGVTTFDLVNPQSTFDQVVGEYSASGATIANYAYGLSLVSQVSPTTGDNYYDFDVQGNTADLTNSSGSVTDSYSYLPFGQQLTNSGSVANPFTFNGEYGVVDQGGGFYLTKSRLYDANLGRFVQRDPGNIASGDTNVYRYAYNDPVDYQDPLGTSAFLLALCQLRQGSPSFFAEYMNYGASVQMENFLQNVASNAAIVNDFIQGTATPIAIKTLQWGRDAIADSAQRLLDKGITEIETADGTVQVVDLAKAVIGDIDDIVGSSAADPVAYAEGLETFAGETVPAAAEVTVTTAARASLGFVTAPVQFAQAAFDYVLYYNKEFPDGTPVPEEEVLNLNSVYRRILKDPLGRLLLNAAASANPGVPVSQDTLNTILQVIAQSMRQTQAQARGSDDPNAIVGPAGYGSAGFVPGQGVLPYEIFFTNDATATAPAAVVTITETLSNNLDWSTFQLGDVGYGSTTIAVPAGLQSYSTSMALSSSLTLDISGTFDAGTGVVTWTFTTIDDATGDVPSDPSLGFLPPDVTPPQGEGFVDYTVSPKAGLATGATVAAGASIVFDNNAAIATPTITNTVDAVAPTSTVAALAANQSRTAFPVSWSGTDDAGGSGLVGYTIYVSEDGGAYAPWLANTTATSAYYLGAPGHTYSFYSQADDGAGNQQTTDAAQATTTVPAIARTLTVSAGKPARFTDAAGRPVIVTLSGPGTGTLSFITTGSGDPVSFTLTGTTAATRVAVSAAGKPGTLTLADVSATGSLASFTAPTANLIGSFAVTGTLGSLSLDNATDAPATITVGGAAVATAFRFGALTDVALTTAAPIKSLSVASWTDGPFHADAITAPSIGTLSAAGNFDPTITLSGSGLDLRSATVRGAVTGGTWTLTGSADAISIRGADSGSLTATSVRSLHVGGDLTGSTLSLTGTGAKAIDLASLTVTGSVDGSAITAGASIGSVSVGGAVTGGTWTLTGSADAISIRGSDAGSLSASSVRSLHVGGSLTGSNLSLTGTGTNAIDLTSLTVTGSVTDSVITAAASIGAATVGGMSGSTLFAGVTAGTTGLPTAASELTAGTAIRSFDDLGRSPFADSDVAAYTIGSATLRDVTTDNGGTIFGVAGHAVGVFALDQPKAKPLRYAGKQLTGSLTTLGGDLRVELL